MANKNGFGKLELPKLNSDSTKTIKEKIHESFSILISNSSHNIWLVKIAHILNMIHILYTCFSIGYPLIWTFAPFKHFIMSL